MTPRTDLPNLKGPLTLDAGERAVGMGTAAMGALAQISGAALGFDLFTPTADCTYLLAIRVQDVASGSPSHVTVDLVTLTSVGPAWAPAKVAPSVTNVGTCATTYTKNGSALQLAVATGTTWYVDVVVLARFPA